jgi:uncharacterized membrane protein HdeD (DUF308 family)
MDRAHFRGRVWSALAIRGLVAILFGILALARPGRTLTGLVYLFAAYVIIDGIADLAASVNVAEMGGRWGAMFLVGLTGILVGVVAFANPRITGLALISYIAVWAIVTGLLEIGAAIRLRKVVGGEWKLALAGALTIVFGIVIAAHPAAGLVSIVSVIGVYAILFGVLMLALALRLRGAERRLVTA